MRCVGTRGRGEALEIHGGVMKRLRKQYQESKLHTRQCVGIALRRIRGGIKA